jgi:hypothetical protein
MCCAMVWGMYLHLGHPSHASHPHSRRVDAVLIEHDKIVNKDRQLAINKVADQRLSK